MVINYLGRGSLRPLGERQAELEGGYGFTCTCARCTLEQDPAIAALAAAVQVGSWQRAVCTKPLGKCGRGGVCTTGLRIQRACAEHSPLRLRWGVGSTGCA